MGRSQFLRALGGFAAISAISMTSLSSASASDMTAASPAQQSLMPISWETPEARDWKDVTANRHRRGYRYRRYRPRIYAGDIITGIFVLGTMAAIANSSKRARRAAEDNYRRNSDSQRSGGGDAISTAMDNCMRAVERDVRVDNVEGVTRSADGWVVRGVLYNGQGFTCQTGGKGDVVSIDYVAAQAQDYSTDYAPAGEDARASRYDANYRPPEDNQFADTDYADAWQRQAMAERTGAVQRAGYDDAGDVGDAYPVTADPVTADSEPAQTRRTSGAVLARAGS